MLVFQRLTRHCDDGQQYESRRSLHVPDLSLQQAPPALEMGVALAKRRHAGLVIERQEIATTRHKKILRPFLARSPAEGLETISVLQHTKNKSDFDIAVHGGIAFDRTLDYGKAGWVLGQFRLRFCFHRMFRGYRLPL